MTENQRETGRFFILRHFVSGVAKCGYSHNKTCTKTNRNAKIMAVKRQNYGSKAPKLWQFQPIIGTSKAQNWTCNPAKMGLLYTEIHILPIKNPTSLLKCDVEWGYPCHSLSKGDSVDLHDGRPSRSLHSNTPRLPYALSYTCSGTMRHFRHFWHWAHE